MDTPKKGIKKHFIQRFDYLAVNIKNDTGVMRSIIYACKGIYHEYIHANSNYLKMTSSQEALALGILYKYKSSIINDGV